MTQHFHFYFYKKALVIKTKIWRL